MKLFDNPEAAKVAFLRTLKFSGIMCLLMLGILALVGLAIYIGPISIPLYVLGGAAFAFFMETYESLE